MRRPSSSTTSPRSNVVPATGASGIGLDGGGMSEFPGVLRSRQTEQQSQSSVYPFGSWLTFVAPIHTYLLQNVNPGGVIGHLGDSWSISRRLD